MTFIRFPSGEEMHLDMAPNQPRDRLGKWTNNPGSAVSGAFPISAKPAGFGKSPDSRAHRNLKRLEAAGVVVKNREESQATLARLEESMGIPSQKLVDSMLELPPEILHGATFRADTFTEGMGFMRVTVDAGSNQGLKKDKFFMERKFNPNDKSVEHETLVIPPHLQGKGLGKRLLAKQVEAYQAPGSTVASVHVSAGLSRGAYAWGKFGFTPNDPKVTAQFFKKYMSKDPLTRKLLDTVKDQKSWYRFVDSAVGKAFLPGQYWVGDLKLNDPATMSRFRKYVKQK